MEESNESTTKIANQWEKKKIVLCTFRHFFMQKESKIYLAYKENKSNPLFPYKINNHVFIPIYTKTHLFVTEYTSEAPF